MTRQHVSRYQPPADPYAHARCECRHLVYADAQPGDPCRFFGEGCDCTNHRAREVAGNGTAAA